MSEFVGRTGSLRVYSYPEPRRSGGGPTEFARNFATGPKLGSDATDGIRIEWNAIDAGVSPSTDVPITPQSTGVVLISAVVTISNAADDPATFSVRLQMDAPPGNLPVPPGPIAIGPIAAGETVVVPLLMETPIVVGETHTISIFVLGEVVVVAEGSTLNLQEVSVATG